MPSRLFAFCLAAIVLIGPLSLHLMLPAIPAVKAEFGLTEATAQLTFSVGIFAMAFSTLVYGTLSDRYGRRPVLLGGLALFLAGCLLLSIAQSFAVLMAGRLLQAVGAGCAATLVRSIARDAYGQAQLAKAIAYITMFYTMGPMIAPLMGGILIDSYGWRAAFVFALCFGAVITSGAYLVLYETYKPTPARFDLLAVLRSYIDPFRLPKFAVLVLQTGFSSGVFFTLSAASAVIMKEQLDRPATEYGLYFLLFPLGFLIGNLVSSRLTARVRGETMVLTGSLVNFFFAGLQAVLLLAGYVSPATLFIPGFFMTMAQGLSLPSAQAGAMALVPSSIGTAAGIGVFTQMFIGAAVAQLYGLLAGPSLVPLAAVSVGTAGACLVCGLVAYRLGQSGSPSGSQSSGT